MEGKKILILWMALAFILAAPTLAPRTAWAHCDGLDGPVVAAAREALETGDVNRVLIWVPQRDEGEIRAVFQKTLAVRKLSPEARDLADRYLFEALVRVHRAGEGAPYTGLKPAGRDLGPVIPAADRALESGSAEALRKLVTEAAAEGVRRHFQAALAKRSFRPDDLGAGREYVGAYVSFIHYVERLYETATGRAEGHYPEEAEAGAHR